MNEVTTNVLYGAGNSFLNYKEHWEKNKIVAACVCDADIQKQGSRIGGLPILSLTQCLDQYENVHFYLTILDEEYRNGIINDLTAEGICQNHIHVPEMNNPNLLREFCASHHVHAMDNYFDEAEQAQSIQTFWGSNTPFCHYFQMLDLESIVELACGRGRHVPQYSSRAGLTVLEQKVIDWKVPNLDCITIVEKV